MTEFGFRFKHDRHDRWSGHGTVADAMNVARRLSANSLSRVVVRVVRPREVEAGDQ